MVGIVLLLGFGWMVCEIGLVFCLMCLMSLFVSRFFCLMLIRLYFSDEDLLLMMRIVFIFDLFGFGLW